MEQELIEQLRDLLTQGLAKTQQELKLHLQSAGYIVNQTKISRLLRKLGAIKTVGSNGEVVYQLPFEPDPPGTETTVHRLVVEIHKNETLIVVRTSPGSASLIARLLDFNAETLNILGSIAGDDTVMVAPASIKNIEESFKSVKALLWGKRQLL